MTIRKYVDLFLNYLEDYVGHFDWEIVEKGKEVCVYALIPTVVGPRKVELNFEEGRSAYAYMTLAQNFPCKNLSQQEFEELMICINRVNLCYSNTVVAFVDINDDGTWTAYLRGVVAPMDNRLVEPDFPDIRMFMYDSLVAVYSFMDSVKSAFSATYLEDYIRFFERKSS